MKWLAAGMLLLLSTAAFSQQQPVVRVEVSPAEVTVGESATLRVTVLVPTWFPKPPVFPNFEVANAITRLPADSSYPTSERVGRDTWSGIVRNYRIYPLSAATYRLAGLTMNVTWANPGSDAAVAEVAVPEVVLRAMVPAGAEGLDPYIAGRSLALSREVDGDIDNLEAGDALVIRHIAELSGLPAIFIPPISRWPETPGVSVYADEPVIEDGDVARRVEQFTLVFEAGGEYQLQEATLDWWNLDTQQTETAALAGLGLLVAGPTVLAVEEKAASPDPRVMLVTAGLALLLALLVARYLPRIARQRKQRRLRHLASEEYALRQLERATSRGDAGAVYAALTTWLERLQPGLGLRQFADTYGSAELQQQADALARSLFGDEKLVTDLRGLYTHVLAAKKAFQVLHDREVRRMLPPLNPA